MMTGPNSSTYTFPNGTASSNSRLLKVDNRGTCQQCHDPTGTSVIGDQYPPASVPEPERSVDTRRYLAVARTGDRQVHRDPRTQHPQSQRKEVRTVRRLTLLLAGAALWLFLAAIPALADGGPHVASVNNGSSSLTADSCAGCHRVHTAQGPMLLKTATEEALCLSRATARPARAPPRTS